MNQPAVSYQDAAVKLRFEGRAFIEGRYVDAKSGKAFDTSNPATGKSLAKVAECDAADVDLAVAAARKAFESGSWSPLGTRSRESRPSY